MIRDALYADLAGAIVDGTPIDWAAAESSDGEGERGLLDRLKLIASVAALHRHLPQSDAALESATAGVETPQRWGHLAVLERIGRGAFGEVYRAWDPRLDREVALKLLPAGSTESEPGELAIIEEGRALARVRHPNVVTLYGAEVIDGRVGLWMELVRGRTLEELVVAGKRWSARGGRRPRHRAVWRRLGGARRRPPPPRHQGRQRDGRRRRPGGADGLRDRQRGRERRRGRGRAPAPLAGTPLYLAPELFAGAEPSAATDVYSLGVLLYYVVTGSYPVRARDLGELRLAHQSHQRIEVRSARPDLRASLAQIIDRATDPDPRRRYPTAEALAACLLPLERRSSLGPWNRRLAVAAVLLAAIGGIGGAWLVRGRQAAPQGESSDRPLLGGERLAGAGAPHRAAAEPVIVVLPFDDRVDPGASTLVAGTGPDSHHFAEGIADEIIRDLGRVDGLAVRSRYSSFAVGRESRDLREIGERLDADLIVTGSVLRSGERLRIQAQLVDVATDVPIWTKRFDRTLASSLDVFAIVDDIARGIVNELRLALGGGRRRYDVDVETYDLYLRARAEVGRGGRR